MVRREVSPACAVGPGSRTLAIQGGRLPVTSGSSGTPGGGDDHNSDTRGSDLRKLSVPKNRALSCTAGNAYFLEQLLLLCNRRVELRFDCHDSLFRLPDVETRAELDTQQFVGHVERRHHGDALRAHHFSGPADLVHLAVEVCDRLHERFALAVSAGDPVSAPQEVYFDGVGGFWHPLRASPATSKAGLRAALWRRRFFRAGVWRRPARRAAAGATRCSRRAGARTAQRTAPLWLRAN